MKKIKIESLLVEFFFSGVFSFVGSMVASFLAWAKFVQVEGESSPGTGIGFLIVLMHVVPTWLFVAIFGVVYSNIRYNCKQDFAKRFAISLMLPIVATTAYSIIITVTILN